MHEVSLVESLVALVEDERRKQGFSRVRVIRLRLGVLGHAEPEAMRFCFDAVTSGTIADGARLEIEMVAGQGWCSGCRLTVPLDERFASCPICGNAHVRLTAGDELRLAELEVE
ncbi:MAG: hydrogenase maturation nickel metallochaperone HypA [Aliidongia sp.]